MKRWISLLLAVCMLFTLVACGPKDDKQDQPDDNNDQQQSESAGTYKFGGIGPLTGEAAIYGNAVKNGATIAVEEINALGGVQINLDFEDDVADGETSVNAYNTLVDWGMQCLVGTVTTGACIAVSAETYKDRIFALTPSASSVDVIDGKDNMFQVCFTDPNQGTGSATYMAANMPEAKIAIIYRNDDAYSQGIRDTFVTKASEEELNIVYEGTFTADTATDFSVQLNAAQAAEADLIFLPIYYQPASVILKQANDMGYKPKFFGVDGMDGILTLAGFDESLAEGVMLLTPFNADATDEKTQAFVKSYKDKFGEIPNQFAADAYDCVYALQAALEKGGCTPDMSASDVCDKLVEVFTSGDFTFDGLTGETMAWSDTGEVSKEPKGMVIQGGQYVGME